MSLVNASEYKVSVQKQYALSLIREGSFLRQVPGSNLPGIILLGWRSLAQYKAAQVLWRPHRTVVFCQSASQGRLARRFRPDYYNPKNLGR